MPSNFFLSFNMYNINNGANAFKKKLMLNKTVICPLTGDARTTFLIVVDTTHVVLKIGTKRLMQGIRDLEYKNKPS